MKWSLPSSLVAGAQDPSRAYSASIRALQEQGWERVPKTLQAIIAKSPYGLFFSASSYEFVWRFRFRKEIYQIYGKFPSPRNPQDFRYIFHIVRDPEENLTLCRSRSIRPIVALLKKLLATKRS